MNIKYVIKDDIKTVGDVLKKRLKLSRRLITELKQEQRIFLNGNPVFTNVPVKLNDTIEVNIKDENTSETIIPQEIPIDILYEDEFFLAVNKPKGMVVHPTLNYKNGTLGNAVMYYYRDTPFVFRPVLRLDKDTSGIVVIAKNKLISERFSEQLKNHDIKKTYHAIVCGSLDKGIIEAPIARSSDSIIKRCVSPSGAYSKTEYEVIFKTKTLSFIKVTPVTGRTHQIRVHMAHIGCPLYADFLYGTEIKNETFYLHCSSLEFIHPITQKKLKIECNLPEYFKKPLE